MPSPSLIVISCLGLFRVSPVNHAEPPRQTRGTSSVRGVGGGGRFLEGHVTVELEDDDVDLKEL